MKKKCLTLLLALVMCFGLLPTAAFAAASDFVVDEYGVLVSYHGSGGDVVIPDGITKIGDYAFGNSVNLTSVTLPNGVTEIGNSAFEGCTNLSSVTFPNSLIVIDDYAFHGCLNLADVMLPNQVTSVGCGAFQRCASLSSITIPNSVTRIEDQAFEGCTALTNVTLSKRITELGFYTFANCYSLTRIDIPDGVTSIYAPFYHCPALTIISIPASVIEFKNGSFLLDCDNLSDIYYSGTETQWKRIYGQAGNEYELRNVTIHYNSTAPCVYAHTFDKGVVTREPTISGEGEIVYTCTLCGVTITNPIPKVEVTREEATKIFTDLSPDGYYLNAVAWAVENEVTTGTTATTFSPAKTCTHGEILTFLWRAAGKPNVDIQLPFAFTTKGFYADAARWAYYIGMINRDFNPYAPCTRADAVRYIWWAFGTYTDYDGRFTDVPANSPYATAVAWAVANGVTNGATATTFNPNGICNRGQIVTFLYRYFGK